MAALVIAACDGLAVQRMPEPDDTPAAANLAAGLEAVLLASPASLRDGRMTVMSELAPPTVAVTGTAERTVPPDTFVLTGRVQCRDVSSAAVHELLAARVAELEAAVDGLGVASTDVKRGPVNGWRDGRGRGAAWMATREIRVSGHLLESAADVAGALGGIEDVTVEGPYWQLDRDNPAWHELQAEAVHAALARAERYADACGARLGRLVELRDPGDHGGGWQAQAAMTRGGFGVEGNAAGLESLDMSPQPVPISASVQARWYLDLPE